MLEEWDKRREEEFIRDFREDLVLTIRVQQTGMIKISLMKY